MESKKLLSVEGLTVVYNKILTALDSVSLDVNEGEIVAVLGANGAGKSSLLKAISGLIKPQSGSIIMDGTDISQIAPNKILARGIAHVPEGRMIVPHFSVRENLMVGAHIAEKKSISHNLEHIFELFPILKERSGQMAGTLSGGEQQMLAIGRALMSNPRVLLLDEPSLGLAPIVVDKVMEMVCRINKEQHITIMLIEQNAFIALETADRAYVMENGMIAMQGNSAELMCNEELKKKYLAG
jgi:branched-chain amino acid transport system ATP-binding protein